MANTLKPKKSDVKEISIPTSEASIPTPVESDEYQIYLSYEAKVSANNNLSAKWKERREQIGSQDLPENFVTDSAIIERLKNVEVANSNGTTMKANQLSNYAKQSGGFLSGSGELEKNQFDIFLHKNLNMAGLDSSSPHVIDTIHDYFDRYYSVYPDAELTNVYHYIFMTRPDCYLLEPNSNPARLRDEVKRDSLIENVFATRPHVIKNLITYGSSSKNSPMYIPGPHRFMPMITSRCESLQIANTELRTAKLQQPYTHYTQHYGLHIVGSTGIDFSMTFREMADLSIHYLISTWMNYISDVMKGQFSPKKEYIQQNRADYMVSIYDIMLAPDAESILYWVKITGAFPTDNDNSGLSFNLRGQTSNQTTIPFVAYRIEPIDPMALVDFNFNAGITNNDITKDINLCNPFQPSIINRKRAKILDGSGNPWANGYSSGYAFHKAPFIYYDKKTKMYKLGWDAI